MKETPLFITQSGEKLYAIIHHPRQAASDKAFIFCHPFAEEKLWSHRVYVNFARELAQQGYTVIRFDMRGHGDSDGEFAESTVERHVEDTLSVIDYLKQNFPDVKSIGLFGLRLGASIAALTAEKSDDVNLLMLWEPIVNGDRYMQEILRSNLAAQMAAKGKVEITREDLVNDMKAGNPVNVEGYPITYDYFSQISAIDLINTQKNSTAKCLINQVVRNEKQPIHKDMLATQATYTNADVEKSLEQPFWREIREYYYRANNLFATSLAWLEKQS